MQKRFIAVAVASLLAAPTFAQSSVTMYGTIDYGFVSLGSSSRDHATPAGNKKYATRNAIDSGISKSNRFGFRGSEDLGNGLKAVFVLEQGLNGDTGSLWNSSQARQSYAGLAGNFGTVTLGRQHTPQHNFTIAVDPFRKNGLGTTANVLMQDKRLSNLAAYTSPSWGGFRFVLGYTLNASDNENIENNGDTRVWAIAPSFTMDKLFVAANYHAAKLNHAHNHGGALNNKSVFNVLDLYGSYDFGFVKLGSTIGRRTTKKDVIAPNKDSKLTQWMIGATFKVSPSDSILTSYSRASENKLDDNGARRISQFAVGYEHALSKRTVLYSQFAMQSHNKAFKDAGAFYTHRHDSTVGSPACSNLSSVCSPLYRRGFTAGFRHDF